MIVGVIADTGGLAVPGKKPAIQMPGVGSDDEESDWDEDDVRYDTARVTVVPFHCCLKYRWYMYIHLSSELSGVRKCWQSFLTRRLHQ